MDIPYVEELPIPEPIDELANEAEACSQRLISISKQTLDTRAQILDWLRVEYEIAKPSRRLQALLDLDSDALVAEVKKLRGKGKPLSVAGLRALREEHSRTIEPARKLRDEAGILEHRVSELVNAAYGLTADEIELMWKTAPPRMPTR